MPDPTLLVLAMVVGAFFAGWYGERARAEQARRKWYAARKGRNGGQTAPSDPKTGASITDPTVQLRLVMAATFEKRRILSASEARVFSAAEKAIKAHDLTWRVMAQVSLGEVLSSPDARAYGAINSKRVDLLIVSSGGEPIAAIEYQGSGHYLGSAPARDAVKKEALRRAGVRYVEITPEHGAQDVAREINHIATWTKNGPAG